MKKSLLFLTFLYSSTIFSSISNSKYSLLKKSNLNPIPFEIIEIRKAKKIFKKRKVVKVAVIDTGIDINHSFFKSSGKNIKKSPKNWILGTKAKPPLKFTRNRHDVKLLKMVNFRGGWTLVRNYFCQLSKHLDVSAKGVLVFLARRKS